MVEVDVRGFSCPVPLMRTKKALEAEPEAITVLVDSGTAKANVVNLLKDSSYDVAIEETAEGWTIIGKKSS
ncbi:sulfurtransferase TusA family protein [Coriobacteriia bacterium Es71-Z0120]|uniref:sulfurtransferase TusA family protein n=1 Tax=Parvivirga hydrogeniphila TaxID=2939460 RepID=UPI002260ABC4|nr:sulfurtransferase TusA family protein [Parvivirga hydrogeniphila]MCL4078044.1 sulfurtransferase TusA family protein [Parvivirga hydrogeniphila]